MNGGDDQFSRELMRMVGSLEEGMKATARGQDEIKTELREIRHRLDDANSICQEFELFKEDAVKYRESRKDLPQQISTLRNVANEFEEMVPIIKKSYDAGQLFLEKQPEYDRSVKRFNWFWSMLFALQAVIVAVLWIMKSGVISVTIP